MTVAPEPLSPGAAPLNVPLAPPGGMNQLDVRTRAAWLLGAGVSVVIATAVLIVAELIVNDRWEAYPVPPPVGAIGVGLLLTAWAVWLCFAGYQRYRYELRDDELVVQSGVIFQTRRFVPRVRIQHVDIHSGPIDRAMGIVEVHLYVAGGMGPVIQIPGLAPEAAERLKEKLVVDRTDSV